MIVLFCVIQSSDSNGISYTYALMRMIGIDNIDNKTMILKSIIKMNSYCFIFFYLLVF